MLCYTVMQVLHLEQLFKRKIKFYTETANAMIVM